MLSDSFEEFLKRYEKRLAEIAEIKKANKKSNGKKQQAKLKDTIKQELVDELSQSVKMDQDHLIDTITKVVKSDRFLARISMLVDDATHKRVEVIEKKMAELQVHHDLLIEEIESISMDCKGVLSMVGGNPQQFHQRLFRGGDKK